MQNIVLTAEQVITIRRRNRNPDVAIGPDTHFYDLKRLKSYKKAVNFFNKRIKDRYFAVGEQLSKRKKHKSGDIFIVMILNCIIIDFLSQYCYGLEAQKSEKFKEFFNTYLSQYNLEIKPSIKSCSFSPNGRWKRVKIKNIAEALYHGFRCSLIHSGIISEYGRINEKYKKAIEIKSWESNKTKRDIIVNPPLLLEELKKTFKQYIHKLRYSKNSNLRDNFNKRFEFDYGVKITKP